MNACCFFLERCLKWKFFRAEKIRVTTNQVWEIPNLFLATQITEKKISAGFAPHPLGENKKTIQQECRAYTVTMDESRDSCTVEIRRPNGSSFVAKGGGGTTFLVQFFVAEDKFGCFQKCWYQWYPTTIGFPPKNDHFGVFWGYHHLRKHPNILW